jgi:hypothetical protein
MLRVTRTHTHRGIGTGSKNGKIVVMMMCRWRKHRIGRSIHTIAGSIPLLLRRPPPSPSPPRLPPLTKS